MPRTAFLAEFVGTLLLVLFVGLTFGLNSAAGLGIVDFAVLGLVHLTVLVVLVAVLGGRPGTAFNPAVTVALAALRRIEPVDALVCVALQLAGGLAGALLVRGLLGAPEAELAAPRTAGIDGVLLPAFAAELLGTLVLAAALLAVAGDRAGLVAGAAFALGVMTLAPLTGAAFNPARAVGATVAAGGAAPAGVFVVVYLLAPLVGALLATAVAGRPIAEARPVPGPPAGRPVVHRPVVHRPVDARPVGAAPARARPADEPPVERPQIDHRPAGHRPVDLLD